MYGAKQNEWERPAMMQTGSNSQKVVAVTMLLVCLAVSILLGVRCYGLYTGTGDLQKMLAQAKDRAAMETLNSISLPPNRKLTVCNNSPADITISAVAAVYWDVQGKLKNFNSAKEQWHTWRLSSGSTQQLNLTQQDGTAWDGSIVFYAMDVNRQGKDLLVSGTSDDLKGGCIQAVSDPAGR